MALALPLLTAGSAMAGPESAGREGLVAAFDAAWTRVVRSGQYRDMINEFDEPIAGVIEATDYVINQSDCLPNTDLTPFPSQPKGLLAQILNDEVIRRGTVASSIQVHPGGTTSDWFTRGDPGGPGHADISGEMLDAILTEIAAHYGTGPIAVVDVDIPFPFNTTSALLDGIFGFNFGGPNAGPVFMPGVTADFIDQVNAKGGRTENMRRLTSRRSTCTFNSSGQFIHIPQGSPLVAQIQSIDDLRADDSISICTGNLSTQLAGEYFPTHTVVTERGEDIVDCYANLLSGDSDIIINSLPVLPSAVQLGVAGPDMAPSVDTKIVAGTPYWVAMEGITCTRGPFPFQFGTCTGGPGD